MDITLSEDQDKAVEELLLWYTAYRHGPNAESQIFTLSGYAGTGKSTIAAYIRNKIPDDRVAYVSFTGKAAYVLREKLIKQDVLYPEDYVGTIHSLIYRPYFEDEEDKKGNTKKKLKFSRINNLKEDIDIIIVDEASMVGTDIFRDIMGYGIPILFIGDNAQLPPVKALPGVDLNKPDFQLTHIHRQAEGNPIIRFSRDIREGKMINYGKYADNINVLPKTSNEVTEIKNNYNIDRDMFLCGLNRTRVKLNKDIRKILGITQEGPQPGDRVICLKNNKSAGIFNGMVGILKEIKGTGSTSGNIKHSYYKLEVDFGDFTYSGKALVEQFNRQKPAIDLVNEIFEETRKAYDLFDFGYCISTHKSQGSEFSNVVVFRETCPYWDQRKWDYTAVTRAVDNLYFIV